MTLLSLRPVPRLSVIVPVHDGGSALADSLTALEGSDLPREEWELIVIDDASLDGSVTAAARAADCVVRLPDCARGPAYARNRGVELARAPIVAFVDADVVVQPQTLRCLLERLEGDASVTAVFAVYDGVSPVAGVLSQYLNLLHHVAALRYGDGAVAGGAACWAVRRDALAEVGMFDEWRFHGTLGEDLEVSHRLRAGGRRVLRDRSVVVTHLKQWTLQSLVSHVWGRGVMLSRLLGPREALRVARGDALHVLANPWMAAGAAATLWGTVALRMAGLGWGVTLTSAAIAFAILHFAAFSLYALRRGLMFTGIVVPMHLLVQGVATAAVIHGWLLRHVIGDPAPDVTTQAYAEVGVQTWPPIRQRR